MSCATNQPTFIELLQIFFLYSILTVSEYSFCCRSSSSSKKLKKSETSKALLASVTKELPALTKDVIKKWNSLSTKVINLGPVPVHEYRHLQ